MRQCVLRGIDTCIYVIYVAYIHVYTSTVCCSVLQCVVHIRVYIHVYTSIADVYTSVYVVYDVCTSTVCCSVLQCVVYIRVYIHLCIHVYSCITYTRRILICDVTHSYVWRDAFVCVTWRIHMWDMTHSYMGRDSIRQAMLLNLMWYRIRMCDVTHSYVGHDSFIHGTWLNHPGDATETDVGEFLHLSPKSECDSVLNLEVCVCVCVLQCTAVCCSMLQCVAVYCSASLAQIWVWQRLLNLEVCVRCSVCCSVMQCFAKYMCVRPNLNGTASYILRFVCVCVLQCNAVWFSVLRCVCVLQCVHVFAQAWVCQCLKCWGVCWIGVLQCVAACCYVLLHVAACASACVCMCVHTQVLFVCCEHQISLLSIIFQQKKQGMDGDTGVTGFSDFYHYDAGEGI